VRRPPGKPDLDPGAYRRWYESALGSVVDADEIAKETH
jgi:hypothetical protein